MQLTCSVSRTWPRSPESGSAVGIHGRVKALPPDYQIVYKEIQRYLFKAVPIDLPDGRLLTGIVDFFEPGQGHTAENPARP